MVCLLHSRLSGPDYRGRCGRKAHFSGGGGVQAAQFGALGHLWSGREEEGEKEKKKGEGLQKKEWLRDGGKFRQSARKLTAVQGQGPTGRFRARQPRDRSPAFPSLSTGGPF